MAVPRSEFEKWALLKILRGKPLMGSRPVGGRSSIGMHHQFGNLMFNPEEFVPQGRR